MPVPMQFMRGFIGAICIFFAHFLGRAIGRCYSGKQPWARITTWSLRTVVAGAAVIFRAGFDAVTIIVYALAIAAAAIGFYDEIRPKQVEDLTHQIFPHGEDRD